MHKKKWNEAAHKVDTSQLSTLLRIRNHPRTLGKVNAFIPLNALNIVCQLKPHSARQTGPLVIIQLISLAAAKHNKTGFVGSVCGWTGDDVEMDVRYLLSGSGTWTESANFLSLSYQYYLQGT